MKNVYPFTFLILLLSIALFFRFFISFPHDIETNSLEFPHDSHTQNTTETKTLTKTDSCTEDGAEEWSDTEILHQTEWELVWQDEFEGNCLDIDKWNVEDWAAEKNNELQYYSPTNVKVTDGVLKLISKKETFKGREYTSGAVHTQGKFDFLYGKAEMRAKLPAGQGIFPAFWMMTAKENIWLPEIDIMEMLGHQPDEIWMVSHWLNDNGTLKSDSHSFKGPDFSQDFHIFSIEWDSTSIRWRIDGIEQFRTDQYVPRENMYLYLNTAVGGNWPGSPDDTTIFPVYYEIDYVRVFKNNQKERY